MRIMSIKVCATQAATMPVIVHGTLQLLLTLCTTTIVQRCVEVRGGLLDTGVEAAAAGHAGMEKKGANDLIRPRSGRRENQRPGPAAIITGPVL